MSMVSENATRGILLVSAALFFLGAYDKVVSPESFAEALILHRTIPENAAVTAAASVVAVEAMLAILSFGAFLAPTVRRASLIVLTAAYVSFFAYSVLVGATAGWTLTCGCNAMVTSSMAIAAAKSGVLACVAGLLCLNRRMP
jgi:hypothetical protein